MSAPAQGNHIITPRDSREAHAAAFVAALPALPEGWAWAVSEPDPDPAAPALALAITPHGTIGGRVTCRPAFAIVETFWPTRRESPAERGLGFAEAVEQLAALVRYFVTAAAEARVHAIQRDLAARARKRAAIRGGR